MIPPRPAVIAHGKVLRVLKTTPSKAATVLPSVQVVRLASPSCVSGSFNRLSFALGANETLKIPLGNVQTKNYRSHIAMGFEPTIA